MGYKPNLILGARQINNGMAKYIAERTIKEMIHGDKKIKDSNILVLGLTFKEDCPDIRNSKVYDIIDELLTYECNVDVYDPWVDADIVQHDNFELIDNPFEQDKKYDSIVLAVGHSKFKEITKEEFEKITHETLVTIDVKGIMENPTWRL
jgi:UDP-N-acetyl-D-galactosamine dehydrogenase